MVAVAGLVLFFYAVRSVGFSEVANGIRRLGFGFLALLLFSAIREAVRALAWIQCLEEPSRLAFGEAFAARISGDALGNLTPLGALVSEPAKAVYVRTHVPLGEGLASVAIENLLYSFSVAFVIVAGTISLLFNFDIPPALRTVSVIGIGVLVALVVAILWVIRVQPRMVTGTLGWLQALPLGHRLASTRLGGVAAIEDQILTFASRHRDRLPGILFLQAIFHVVGVAEVYVTIAFISPAGPPTLLAAFILESVNRLITVAFKFVPLRLGVDEAGTGLVTRVLQLGTAIGVTMAIVRKARILFWSAIGLAFLVRRGFSIEKMVGEAERAETD